MSSHLRTSHRRPGHRLTKEQTREAQEKFLNSFASNGNIRMACVVAGIDRSTVRVWSEHDEQFGLQYNLAKEDVNDAIRAEIVNRAISGEERFVTSMGKVVYHEGQPLTIREKSDALLMFHARARMPEYRDKQTVDVNNISGTPGTIPINTKDLTNEELALLKHIALRQKAQQGEI